METHRRLLPIHHRPAVFPGQFSGVLVPAPGPVFQAMLAVAIRAALRRGARGKDGLVIGVLGEFSLRMAGEAERRARAGVKPFRVAGRARRQPPASGKESPHE